VLEEYAEAKAAGKTFSQMVAQYDHYKQTEDVVVAVPNKQEALKAVEQYLQTLKPKTIKKFDGLIVDFGLVWGAVKPSVTEFALKVMFEGVRKKAAQDMQNKVLQRVRSLAKKSSRK